MEQNQDIPSELENIPSELENIPSELENIPSELENIPSELENIPSELENIPGENGEGLYCVEIRSATACDCREAFQVWLKIGRQEFQVGSPRETHASASWYGSMLEAAMEKVAGESE